MTERSRGLPVVTIAGTVFCLLLIYLALQIRAGNDPSIGAGKPSAAAAPRQVIVRRIIVRRVIEEDAPAGASSGGAAPAPVGTESQASSPAPATPAAAPAPAPAPAPVVSSAS